MPSFSHLIQLYFIIITTIALLAATLPALHDSILLYGKLDFPSPASSSSTAPPKSAKKSINRSETKVHDHSTFFAVLGSFKVPKAWFAHFYVFASFWMIYLTLDLLLYTSCSSASISTSPCQISFYLPQFLISSYHSWSFLRLLNLIGIMPTHYLRSSMTSWTPPPEIVIAMFCYWIQVLRRWYESWFVEQSSKEAKLHLGHYFVGISFYAAMAPALWVDAYETWSRSTTTAIAETKTLTRISWMNVNPWCWMGMALFLWASWHQHRCHVILANLRRPESHEWLMGSRNSAGNGTNNNNNFQKYKVPFGDWFEYLVTPHYSAEMVIYFGLYLMVSSATIFTIDLPSLPISLPSLSRSIATDNSRFNSWAAPTMLYAWIWVVVNLGVVARETDQWYRSRFGEGYAGTMVMETNGMRHIVRKRRAILIPFIY
ncbi:hypothetical protein BCR41DRAFT_344311 [Lobosporangium transversale]|uniref:3-oxo-5-alpha-steroid 4-dehydrogenase C-terminal domain-containing protein n=1 Tax=Lobosporangium transversale TaxID=64571 RepID=A0A1Y2H4J0_9FUNG|nr:hypothetical protein BCR41DRAFT_344311 [Lobosporangium transversale]ORZ28934.1 hypothetical protein BCR41DRAFT_344311 [Lobosporangium transversale]|eukprot:XP_021886607.1 hypothetical protein BCR41DRAFT_344311 [Lobosporangium transversale]